MLTWILTFIFIIMAYVVGSVCSAVVVAKIFNLPDPRLEGSKNPGATNMLRIAGKPYAILVLVGDMLKGTLPVLIAHFFGLNAFALGWVLLAAVLGHIYPVFFNFEGGKGVATTLGALLGFEPKLGMVVILTWLITAFISKISSLSAIVAVALLPIALLFTPQRGAFFPLLLLSVLVIYQHRENIQRLRQGIEPRMNFKK